MAAVSFEQGLWLAFTALCAGFQQIPVSKPMSHSCLYSIGHFLGLSPLGSGGEWQSFLCPISPRDSLFQALGSGSQLTSHHSSMYLISSTYFIDFTHLLTTSLLVSSLLSLCILIIII